MKSMRIGVAGVAGGCPRQENNTNNGREERRNEEAGDMSTRRKLTTWADAVAIMAGWLLAGVVQGGIIPTDNVEVKYQQTIFADTFEGDTGLDADIGGYANYMGSTASIIDTTGASGASTDVLQVSKPSDFNSAPGLRIYFTTTDPVNPASYTLNFDQNYDPGQPHSNYIRISFDWKPVTGGVDAGDSFGAAARTESAPGTITGSQAFIRGAFQRYASPESGWRLYTRGPGGVNDYLTGGGRGEVYSTGTYPTLVPDGRWYHIVAEFSVPDASENYEWSMAFTPYDANDGTLLTASTATTGGSGTFSANALYSFFDIVGAGAAKVYTWYVDNLQAEFLVLGPPTPQGTVLSIR